MFLGQAFLPLLAATTPSGQGVLATALRSATVVAGFSGTTDASAALQDAAAVDGAQPPVIVREIQLLREGATAPADYTPDQEIDPSQFPMGAVVVDCARLSAVLREPLSGCGSHSVYRLSSSFQSDVDPEPGTYEALDRNGLRSSGMTVTLPAELPVLQLPDGLVRGIDGFQLYGDILFTTLPGLPERPDSVLVATDGDAATVEAVRAALGPVRTTSHR